MPTRMDPGADDFEEAPSRLDDEPEPELLDWAVADVAMVAGVPADYLVDRTLENRGENYVPPGESLRRLRHRESPTKPRARRRPDRA